MAGEFFPSVVTAIFVMSKVTPYVAAMAGESSPFVAIVFSLMLTLVPSPVMPSIFPKPAKANNPAAPFPEVVMEPPVI